MIFIKKTQQCSDLIQRITFCEIKSIKIDIVDGYVINVSILQLSDMLVECYHIYLFVNNLSEMKDFRNVHEYP